MFLLSAVCAAHLLRTTTIDLKYKIGKHYITSDIPPSQHGSLPSTIQSHQLSASQQLCNFDIQNKVSQIVSDRFQRLSERLEEYIPSTITSASLNDWTLFRLLGERQELQVNILMAERRRRTGKIVRIYF